MVQKATAGGWAEDRLCETWCSGFDPDHPAAIEAAQWEHCNARLLAEARQVGAETLGRKHGMPQSATRRLLAWITTIR